MLTEVQELLGLPAVAALLPRILARVATADRVVHTEEARALLPMFPAFDADALTEALIAQPPVSFAPHELAAAIPDEDVRRAVLSAAVKMAWMDREVLEAEVAALREIAAALDLHDEDVREMLAGIVAGPGRVPTRDEVEAALGATAWEDLTVGHGPPRSALARVVPEGEEVLAVISVGSVEHAIVTGAGIAGSFAEGDAFVRWDAVRMFTRQSTLAAAAKIDTRDFRMRTWVDPQVGPIAGFLDLALAGVEP